jgi:hypothetical protein
MPEPAKLILRKASNVTPRQTTWAWQGRIPLSAVSLLAGREGLGKSTTMIELAALLTRGKLAGDLYGEPHGAIFASAEDSAESTLLPRFMAAGADLDRIGLVEAHDEMLTLPRDTYALAQMAVTAEAKLIVLDPVVSFLPGDVNAHRDQHVRRVLAPLAEIAEEHRLAIVAVIHLNKGDTTDVLARVSGSVGFTAAARSVLVFGRDPEDPEGETGSRRVIAHAKCNVGPQAPSLRAQIVGSLIDTVAGPIHTSRLRFHGETKQTARDLLAQPATSEEITAVAEAAAFLLAHLADAPVPSARLRTLAENSGINWRAIERAKKQLPIRARKTASGWTWELTTDNPAVGLGGVGGLGGKTDKTDNSAIRELPLATDHEEALAARLIAEPSDAHLAAAGVRRL